MKKESQLANFEEEVKVKIVPHRNYHPVEYEQRKQLIDLIDEDHYSIKRAAKKMKIHYSTAKNIVKVYRKEGRIEKLPNRNNSKYHKVVRKPKNRKKSRIEKKKKFLNVLQENNVEIKEGHENKGEDMAKNLMLIGQQSTTESPQAIEEVFKRISMNFSIYTQAILSRLTKN